MIRMYLSLPLKPHKPCNKSHGSRRHIDGEGLMEEQDAPGDGKDCHGALDDRYYIKGHQL